MIARHAASDKKRCVTNRFALPAARAPTNTAQTARSFHDAEHAGLRFRAGITISQNRTLSCELMVNML